MRVLVLLVLTLLVASSAAGQLAPWWIPDEGCIKRCISTSDEDYTLESLSPLTRRRVPFPHTQGGYWDELYSHDVGGDLCWTRDEWLWREVSEDVQWREWSPPLVMLDYPLTTGKTWTSQSRIRTNGAGEWREVTLVGSVVGPRTVETGIGTLSVIEVTITLDGAIRGPRTYYLHEQLGDVRDLLALFDCATVGAEDAAWGSVKAAYR